MKNFTMKNLLTGSLFSFLFSGLALSATAQETLPEVSVVSFNYKYMRSVHDAAASQPVRMLERMAATYDLRQADFYEQEFDNYFVTFYIPSGEILAFYDKNGKILHTAEKFKNIALPSSVSQAVAKRYPGWAITKDVYLVNYYADSNKDPRKIYKLILENGDKRIRVKTNESGSFLE
jgi:hypothetical protein